jgi:hypothetical protein
VGRRTGLHDVEKRGVSPLRGLGTSIPWSFGPWPVAIPTSDGLRRDAKEHELSSGL